MEFMENFKKALKLAITDEVEGILFSVDSPPKLLHMSNERDLTDLNPIDKATLSSIIESLIPEALTQLNETIKGELSIVNFGELHLIGRLGNNPVLYVFVPPQGNQLQEQIWNQLNEPINEQDSENIDIDSMFSISSVSDDSQASIGPDLSASEVQSPTMVAQDQDDVKTPSIPGIAVAEPPPVPDFEPTGSFSQAHVSDFPDEYHQPSESATSTRYSQEPTPLASLGETMMAPPTPSPESSALSFTHQDAPLLLRIWIRLNQRNLP